MPDPYALLEEKSPRPRRWSLSDLSGEGGGVVRSVEIAKGDSPGRDLIDLWLEEVEARPVRLRVYEGGVEIASKLIKAPAAGKGGGGGGGGEYWVLALVEWIVDPDKRSMLITGLVEIGRIMPSISGLAEEWEEGRWRARKKQEQAERRAAPEASSVPLSTSARSS